MFHFSLQVVIAMGSYNSQVASSWTTMILLYSRTKRGVGAHFGFVTEHNVGHYTYIVSERDGIRYWGLLMEPAVHFANGGKMVGRG